LALCTTITPCSASENTDIALKLTVMASFVDSSCVRMAPDYNMIREAFRLLGVSTDELKTRPRLAQGSLLTNAMKRNVKASCDEAWRMFGTDGSVIPGMVTKR